MKSNTFKNINYNIFQNNSRLVSKTSKILYFHVFLKKTPKLKTATWKFLFFSKKFEKMQKVKSNTIKKINYHIFLKIPKFMYKTNPIFNFHVIHKKPQKLKTNTCKFLVFSEKIENKMKNIMSTTFKKLNNIIFIKIPKFLSKTNTILKFQIFIKKTPKLKTNTCEFLFLF